jgi:hypothetical protein
MARRDTLSPQSRDTFEAFTGLALEAPEQYRDIWWSWDGVSTRADSTAAWSGRAAFVVSSLNAQQAADVARRVARGGPGPGSSPDARGSQALPGDSLIDAASIREHDRGVSVISSVTLSARGMTPMF